MSREVRRVKLGWEHPVYTVETATYPNWVGSHIGLCDDYQGAVVDWVRGKDAWEAKTGKDIAWQVKYHITGYQSHDGWHDPVPLTLYGPDGNEVAWEGFPADVDELVARYTWEINRGRFPNPAEYMPVWSDVPDDEMGYALYETVSEGTPRTPTFPTKAQLVDWLVDYGQSYGTQYVQRYRRAAAETLVGQGSSCGTFIVAGGRMFDSATDADLLAARS